jgi:hypothetical protein
MWEIDCECWSRKGARMEGYNSCLKGLSKTKKGGESSQDIGNPLESSDLMLACKWKTVYKSNTQIRRNN